MTALPAALMEGEVSQELTIIRARPSWRLIEVRELWRFRELLWILGMRDVRVRYKQTIIGTAWVVLQPVATMVVFTGLFRLLGRMPADDGQVPYSLIVLAGLLPWNLCAHIVGNCTSCLVGNSHLITKVYFPRTMLPLAVVVTAFVDFAVAFGLLAFLLVACGGGISWTVLLLPAFAVLAAAVGLAAGLWLAALNAMFRDLQYAVPFALQMGFYLTPVVYETDVLVPEGWRWLYYMNPMAIVMQGFRWCLLDKAAPSVPGIVVGVATVATLLLTGAAYFRRVVPTIADKI